MDQELEKIEEGLKRYEGMRRKLMAQRAEKLKKIKTRQMREKEAWLKKLMPLFDRMLEKKLGNLYWYRYSLEHIMRMIARGIDPEDTEDKIIIKKEKMNESQSRDESC